MVRRIAKGFVTPRVMWVGKNDAAQRRGCGIGLPGSVEFYRFSLYTPRRHVPIISIGGVSASREIATLRGRLRAPYLRDGGSEALTAGTRRRRAVVLAQSITSNATSRIGSSACCARNWRMTVEKELLC